MEFMSGLVGMDRESSAALIDTQMTEIMKRTNGYDPIFLYMVNTIDAMRSYMIYGQVKKKKSVSLGKKSAMR
jgi:hypothetical protein